jgi:hypothetical protein
MIILIPAYEPDQQLPAAGVTIMGCVTATIASLLWLAFTAPTSSRQEDVLHAAGLEPRGRGVS